jgi:hypothetical protein
MPNATDNPAPAQPDDVRSKAIRFFTFLKELSQLKTRTIREASAYESVFPFSDVPRERECSTPAWFERDGDSANDEKWLRIEKPERPRRPAPPGICLPWCDPASLDTLSPEPKLHDEIDEPESCPW